MRCRFKVFPVLIIMMLSLAMLQVSGQTNEPEIIVSDSRVMGVNIENGQTYTDSWSIKEDEWFSVQMDCASCTIQFGIAGALCITQLGIAGASPARA